MNGGRRTTILLLALVPLFALLALAVAPLFSDAEQQPPSLQKFLGPPEYKKINPKQGIYKQTRIVSIAGRRFEIPIVYIDVALDPGEVQDGISMKYVLPTYKSKADFPNRQDYDAALKAGRFAHMMFEPEASRPSFDVMIANRKRHLEKIEAAGTFDGLGVERWYHRRGDQLIFYYEVYLEKDVAGNIVSWIECSTLDRPSVTFPGCNHKFRDKYLLYDIHYNKANYLHNWREQRASAIRFIDSFEISQSSTLQQEK